MKRFEGIGLMYSALRPFREPVPVCPIPAVTDLFKTRPGYPGSIDARSILSRMEIPARPPPLHPVQFFITNALTHSRGMGK